MTNKPEEFCFVVMGFGKKTDYETGNTFDMDASYQAIIKPSIEGCGLTCIRADEVVHSGVIDTEMFQMLLRADLVIADISTSNANAIYELGIRHALRPFSTIIMSESSGRLHFDLNHINTFRYKHLGEDIGVREAKRATDELTKLITEVMKKRKPDSPVYTFIPNLTAPVISEERVEEIIEDVSEFQEKLSNYLISGSDAVKKSDFQSAIEQYQKANKLKPNDSFIIQQLALATYKNKKPSPHSALIDAWTIIKDLTPENSNDPETLGIAGAISKNLWFETNDIEQLKRAISFYKRGFEIRRDYYNGENLAYCYNLISDNIRSEDTKLADFYLISAEQIRKEIIGILNNLILGDDFEERTDKKWIYASMANCFFALNDELSGVANEALFKSLNPAEWEIETFEKQKDSLLVLLADTGVPAIRTP